MVLYNKIKYNNKPHARYHLRYCVVRKQSLCQRNEIDNHSHTTIAVVVPAYVANIMDNNGVNKQLDVNNCSNDRFDQVTMAIQWHFPSTRVPT